jgi:hypothetical protein
MVAAAPSAASIADAVLDESMAGHITIGTAGRALAVAGTVLSETTVTGTPTTTTVVLNAGSSVDDYYNDLQIVPLSGSLIGQARSIADYDGATKTVTVDEAWTSALSASDEVIIRADHRRPIYQIAESVRAEIDSNSTQLAAIVSDTNELQTDDIPGTLATLATAANLATVDANVDAILVDTGTTLPAQITALNNVSVSDVLTTQMTEAYAADGTAPTLAQALFLIQQVLTEFSIATTTLTVKKLNGSTTAGTFTLDDATTPTSLTRAT